MKASKFFCVPLTVIGIAVGSGIARADSTDATCEVRKDGDKQKGKSGPCEISQRQGYIDIDLKNGDTISLSPGGKANHYRDQNGINPLDNGAFEVVSSNPFCTVRFNKHGEMKDYSEDCTPEQKRESYEYAQRHR